LNKQQHVLLVAASFSKSGRVDVIVSVRVSCEQTFFLMVVLFWPRAKEVNGYFLINMF
jgi:hypothetical protein